MANPFVKNVLQDQIANHSQPHILHPNAANSKFPFSSPIVEDQKSFRSSRSGNTYLSRNPFHSPDPSHTPSVDGGSDATSGLDEFHLERYSQEGHAEVGRGRIRIRQHETGLGTRLQDGSPTSRPRPGLNIITDFANRAKRSATDGLIMDRVQSSRPQLGHRSATSIASQQVVHDFNHQPMPVAQRNGFVDLNDLIGLRKRKKEKENTKPKGSRDKMAIRGTESNKSSITNTAERTEHLADNFDPSRQHYADRKPMTLSPSAEEDQGKSLKEISPADRSIVIGLSVPRDELEAHQIREDDSGLFLQTPITPAIIVTPAQDTSSWSTNIEQGRFRASKRAVSSVYSQLTSWDRIRTTSQDAPPLPDIRNREGFIVGPSEFGPLSDSEEAENKNSSRPGSSYSSETIFDEDDAPRPKGRPRSGSTESQEAIIETSSSSRPKSKGWWNLMLSPMLSRADTIREQPSPEDYNKMPPIPTQYMHEDVKSEPKKDSHETPRRLGFGSDSTAVWSNWSEWEADREKAGTSLATTEELPQAFKKGHKQQDSAVTVPFMMGATPVGSGLAAEYFHACIVDERGDGPYYACKNHSCLEGLPKLGFIPLECWHTTSQPVNNQHERSMSDSTLIEDEPDALSPNVRTASMAPILKVGPMQTNLEASKNVKKSEQLSIEEALPLPKRPVTPPAYSPPRTLKKSLHVAVGFPMQPQHALASPGPITPHFQQAIAPPGGLSMTAIRKTTQRPPLFVNQDTSYPELPSRAAMAPVSLADIDRPTQVREKAENRRQRQEKEDAVSKKGGGLWRGRGCFPKNGCSGRQGREGRLRRRWYAAIFVCLFLVIVACILLAILLTRKGDHTMIQSQWLNLTGFPPMPTGISTIARPDAVVEDSACVQPVTMWSCAVPKEDEAGISPNDPDQPNFRFEIRFRNGTVPSNETIPLTSKFKRGIFSAMTLFKRQNDPFTDSLYTPAPAAPSFKDQEFLGNTTDDVQEPFDGEQTPFFITFIATSPVIPTSFDDSAINHLHKRQSSSGSVSNAIPPPDIGSDGTAAQANLLPNAPFLFSQPIRLYDRGLLTEHYGFYNYYDRALFFTSDRTLNQSGSLSDVANNPDNGNGGSTKTAATMRCTWSQTRFLFRIWTNSAFGGSLISNPSATTTASSSSPTSSTNSATNFTPPGSFPYPVSITLDRHGGDLTKKLVFCYGMDSAGHIVTEEKVLVAEDRGAGGTTINPAPPLVQFAGETNNFDPNAGGIDGGTGGCQCEWQNWVGNGQ